MGSAAPLIGITCGTPAADQAERYGTNKAYITSVQAAGGVVVMIPPGPPNTAGRVLEHLDALLLPGGADVDPRFYGAEPGPRLGRTDPERDEFELALLAAASDRGTRVMAICRGMQVLNVAAGGTLYQDLPSERPGGVNHATPKELGRGTLAHEIDIDAGSWFATAAGATRLSVNSLHHQAVKDVGGGLTVTARADDGVVEGLETADRRVVAMQCHAEELPGVEWAGRVFRAFVEEVTPARR